MKLIRSHFMAVLGTLCLLQGVRTEQAIAKELIAPDEWKATLTISGGISLGAYEAGLNWAIVKVLKDMQTGALKIDGVKSLPKSKLVAVTGASAGGINALATAIHWCVEPESNMLKNTIEDNLFRDFWLKAGFSELLPESPDSEQYRDGDGLLARSAFDEAVNDVSCLLGEKVDRTDQKSCVPAEFEQGCEIGMGLSLTLEDPISVSVASVSVPIQGMKLPMRASVSPEGNFVFEAESSLLSSKEHRGTANRIALAVSDPGSTALSVEQLRDAVFATSAFPLAFGRKTLKFCYFDQDFRDDPNWKSNPRCPDDMVFDEGKFLDGGVFDNIPINLAVDLAGAQNGRKISDIHHIYLDPDRRRTAARERNAEVESRSNDIHADAYGLLQQLGFVGGAIRSGRSYELYNSLAQSEERFTEHLVLSDRYHRITGTMLGAFGAFLDPKFRELDYYIGVYDAIVDIADEIHKEIRTRNSNNEKYNSQIVLADIVKSLAYHLDFYNNKNASPLFEKLYCAEFRRDQAACVAQSEERDSSNIISDDVLALMQLFDDLNDAANQDGCKKGHSNVASSEFLQDISFCRLAKQLKSPHSSGVERIRPVSKSNPFLRSAARVPQRWFEPIALRVSRRLYKLERDAGALGGDGDQPSDLAWAAGAANYAIHGAYASEFQELRGPRLSDTPIDTNRWLKFLPYEIGLDTRHGGVYASWSPKVRLSDDFDLELKVTPIALPSSGDDVSYYGSVEVGPRWHFNGAFPASSLGAAVGFQQDWENGNEDDNGIILSGNVGAFADKLRLTAAFRRDYSGKSWALFLGFTDFQGLVDWVAR